MAAEWLPVVCVLVLVSCTTEAHEVCVCPNKQCLLDGFSCLPFQTFVQEQELSLGTDVKFSNGTYAISDNDSVNYNMVVRDTRNIRLLGDPSGSTIIECDGKLRFSFINVTNLTITNIQLVSCGVPWRLISGRGVFHAQIPGEKPAALLLIEVHTLLMSNVVVASSQGYGILCINLFNDSRITNTNFISNNKYPSADNVGGGSILLVYQGSFFNQRADVLINNCTFMHCRLTYGSPLITCPKIPSISGLGIVIKQSQYPIHLVVNHTSFVDNDPPTLAVYSHDTPAPYSISIQHSYFENSVRGESNIRLRKSATIMFFNLLNGHPTRTNTTTAVARTITICSSVFNSPPNDKYGFIAVGYIDVTVFLNMTLTIRNCSFQPYVTATAITVRSILYGQGLYPDHDKIVKIIGCNFTSLQDGAITALKFVAAPSFQFLPADTVSFDGMCYMHTIDSHYYSASSINRGDQVLSLLIENSTFFNNTNVGVKVAEVSNLTVINSQFIENKHTALECKGSSIYIRGEVIFIRNQGLNGGAISLSTVTKRTINQSKKIKSKQVTMSFLYLHPDARLLLVNNRATNKGGGIYADTGEPNDKDRYMHELCFYQLVGYAFDRVRLPKIVFVNNTAGYAGDSVYGGFDKECYLKTQLRSIYNVEDFFSISNQLSTSEIATDPDKIYFCRGSVSNCSTSIADFLVYRGQTIYVDAIAVGKNNHFKQFGASPALVFARIDPEHETKLKLGQYGQNLDNRCSQLMYTVYSSNTHITIQLSLSKSEFAGYLEVTILGCPFGFQLEDSPYPGCVCETIVQESGCICSIDDLIISCPLGKWIGNISSGTIVHHHCPFDYCTSKRETRVTALNEQCAFNRSGILCGECQVGLSLGFGSSKCKECTNTYVLLIFPFTLAGLALVLILYVCNLTVSRGTINGLIYFANVVQVNSSIFVTQNTPQFFAVFVAWVNLDLGIQTCFYKGMDMYAKAWLQFVFPVYMWLIVAAIVLLSRYSTTVSKISRDNTVPVLATLFLLSYAKLLRAIITAFSFTYLHYPDEKDIPVWMYDGNVRFATGKHTALLIAALVAMLGFIIPYTLLLLLSPYLQRWSHYKPLRWVNKLKPFLDANHGPYKNRMRNWTGIILLIRAVQFTCFAANAEGDPNINLMIILLIGVAPYLVVWIFGTVYKNKANSILESAFVLLLSTLASASLYIRTISLDVEGKQTAITTSIFAAAFFLFLIIFAYHFVVLIKLTAYVKLPMCRNPLHTLVPDSSATELSSELASDTNLTTPSVSYVALSELATCEHR